MAIKEGDIIKVEYVGTFDDGSIFDSTEANGDNPLKFEVGAGQIIPGFDNSVVGKNVGDEFNIRLEPSEAYGEYKEGMTQSISKDQFPQEPKAGLMIMLMGPQGQPVPATIKEVEDDIVIIDSNHPMAGKILNFKIKVVETGCEPDPPHVCGCGHDHDHDHEH